MPASPSTPVTTDGAARIDPPTRKATQSPARDDVCCIFVHAGAGYHSLQNERIHLEACNDAAQVAMLILRNGGSACDAVEMAVKILEDREITNAGYGSNLAMDGVVECDASIVDHHGRSGAVGAVAQIKNPISLARLVLRHTMQTLTLRRVPPNLLVSQGATDFAYEMGVPVLPYDALVSPAARERWVRWRSDLKAAERKAKKSGNPPSCWKIRNDSPANIEDVIVRRKMREQHEKNMLQEFASREHKSAPLPAKNPLFYAVEETSNSPSSPSATQSVGSVASWPSDEHVPTPESTMSEQLQGPAVAAPRTVAESSRNAFINSTQNVPTVNRFGDYRALRDVTSNHTSEDAEMRDVDHASTHAFGQNSTRNSWGDGSGEESDSTSSATTMKPHQRPSIMPLVPPAAAVEVPLPETPVEKHSESPTPRVTIPLNHAGETAPLSPSGLHSSTQSHDGEDNITDTVGAIAIDSWGNIACGASSGGIGMKYRGRVGPAALVGVGAAVIPIDPDDVEQTCVATVTSGTGEHMATTMAAAVCAERIYQSMKKGKGGEYHDVTEDEALKAMIENEFMGHSSVKNSNSAGAIGILGMKKTRDGVMLYFGHNTDSFAMASMHSDETRPWCAMSRSNGNGQIAQGGRVLRYRQKKKRNPPASRQ
ncbi:N-terminal nucleophile aminohydrolase [Pleomassaria siparia CBS 279.74]|uniref:N-terminal nucleophile aminohydrolase n=1 Tax=Pleomassaria siparia CBS 279.74 TaxID=1314801 RepID=A0A6G1K1B8_9PLEO|nr:N-terminal nucleophile aminohydrolase [Pleomassaria siparia CBS 279.74]